MSLKTLLKTFIKSNRGVNLIEFAFVAPVFFLLIIGLMDVGIMMVIQNALDAGAREAGRFGITGMPPGVNREELIKQKIRDTVSEFSGGIARSDKINIIVKSYPTIENIESPEPFDDTNLNGQYDLGEFYEDVNGNGQWDPDQGTVGSFGASGEAVEYEVSYDWNSFLRLFGFNSVVKLTGYATVRNENFDNS